MTSGLVSRNCFKSTYSFVQGLGPYSTSIKMVEKDIKEKAKKINDLCGMSTTVVIIYN